MLIRKITVGYVVQVWDTKKKRWVEQDFVPGEIEWENEFGESLDENKIPESVNDEYLPLDMIQPNNI